MLVLAKSLLLTLISLTLNAQEPRWQDRIEAGRKLAAEQKRAEAREVFDQVRDYALKTHEDEAGLAADRMLVALARGDGDWKRVDEMLNEALDFAGRVHWLSDAQRIDATATILSEIG